MFALNKIEVQWFKLMNQDISIQEFEQWVYQAEWLEEALGQEPYLALLALNFKDKYAKSNCHKMLAAHLSIQKFESNRVIDLLNAIILRTEKAAAALIETYHLYCSGYYFFKDLGLGIGLFIKCPSGYGADQYDQLNEQEKKALLDAIYPSAKTLAAEIKSWIMTGKLILTGEKDGQLNKWIFIDKRGPADKTSRVWKKEEQNEGDFTVEKNVLLDENGNLNRKKHLNR